MPLRRIARSHYRKSEILYYQFGKRSFHYMRAIR